MAQGALALLLITLLGACDTRPQFTPTQESPATTPTRSRYGQPIHTYSLPGATGPVAAVTLPLKVEVGKTQTVVRLNLADGEALWGFGQRLDHFNLRGSQFDVWTEDAWNRTDTSYFAVPWFVSSAGYGLFINNTGRLHADLGHTNPGEMSLTIPEGGAEIWAVTGTPAQCVAAYSALVGRPQAVPEWTFQPWLSRNSFLSAYEVDHTLDQFTKNEMRIGAVVLEAWEQHLHNFQFETDRYPNPAEWIESLHQRGVHVVCWTTASVWDGNRVTDQARERGFLVHNGDGSEYVTSWLENGRKIDFRKPEARVWWRDLHRPLIALGVDGFKTDGGEHMPDPWFHNEHPYPYQRAALDAFADAGRTGITFARAANPICAGNATFWGGDQHADWSNLTAIVNGGLSAAWSGFFYWSHDIGGYTGTPEKELYVRWLQLGAFSPMMQLHGITAREPWLYDRETLDIARGYFKIRERLQPYLLHLAREAREKGIPLWRPMPMSFPDDPAARTRGDQFMLGPDLLIAPMLTPQPEREVYLPAGRWLDLWSKEVVTGPARLTVKAGLYLTPAYARAESDPRWRTLFSAVPRPVGSPLVLELSGPRNERGLVETQRYLRAGKPETLSYVIRNSTPVVAEGTMTPVVPAGFTCTSARASFEAPAGGELEIHFILSPEDALPAGSYAVQGKCRVGNLSAKTPEALFIQPFRWEFSGPLPGGVKNPSLREKENTLNWAPLPPDQLEPDGFIAFDKLTPEKKGVSFFARATVESPVARPIRLFAGSGDAMTVWLNGKQVLDRPVYRNPLRDEDEVEAALNEGANQLEIRISCDIGRPGFYLRLADRKK